MADSTVQERHVTYEEHTLTRIRYQAAQFKRYMSRMKSTLTRIRYQAAQFCNVRHFSVYGKHAADSKD